MQSRMTPPSIAALARGTTIIRPALRGARIGVLLATSVLAGCGGDRDPAPGPSVAAEPGFQIPGPIFEDVAAATGLDFVHQSGKTGQLYIAELMGSGAALFDYDNDGDLDVYLVQGHLLDPEYDPRTLLARDGLDAVPHDRLFRNDLVVDADGSRSPSFTDVTTASGIASVGYGMGVATGDVDNDGFTDLYVTNLGANQLWRNRGDGTFEDLTEASGAGGDGWGTSAVFFDYDRDGWLDLFVANYVDFSFINHAICSDSRSLPDYCGPASFVAQHDRLFRNLGDGVFEDVSARSQIFRATRPGLGVVAADFNDDGWVDLYVANDHTENLLWLNRQDGTFVDEGLISGAAVNASGERESSMGVDVGDVDGDGHEDLIVAHMDGETNTLYLNNGEGIFFDRTRASGIAAGNRRHTTYAASWIDIDNDGLLDLFNANGAMQLSNEWAPADADDPLPEPNQLYRNLGAARFAEISASAGDDVLQWRTSRAAVLGDVDNDGDTDVLLTNTDGAAQLLVNLVGNRNHWLGLRVTGTAGHRDMLDALVVVSRPDGSAPIRRVGTDGGYLSANDPRVLVGLGNNQEIASIELRWPDGTSEVISDLETDRYTTIHRTD